MKFIAYNIPKNHRAFPNSARLLAMARRGTGGGHVIRSALRAGSIAAAGLTCLVAGGAYFDEGFRRSLIFWGQAFPIYLHYELVHQLTKGKSNEEIEMAFNTLHDFYSPVAKGITLQLRGFYLKTAQLCSTITPDTVPPQYMKWCRQMQDEVPTPFESGQARRLVEEALGQSIEDLFDEWSDEPYGSASIGQVHKAKLKDGTEVAIKIQYPRIEQKFRSDLTNIIRFCKLAMPQHVKPLQEIEKQFLTEFDYVAEAKNLEEIAENLSKGWSDRVVVPHPIFHLCTKTVLTMEYVPGVPLLKALRNRLKKLAEREGKTVSQLEEEFQKRCEDPSGETQQIVSLDAEARRMWWMQRALIVRDVAINTAKYIFNNTLGFIIGNFKIDWCEPPLNIAALIKLLLEVHAHEIFLDGIFNGDPHPGNILLMPDGRLGLIDYGQVKRLDLQTRLSYAKLIVALSEDNREEIVRLFREEMHQKTKFSKDETAYKLLSFWHDRYTPDIVGDHNLHTFLEAIEAQDPMVEVNEDYVMTARVSVLMRGFGNMMGLSLRVAPIWKPYAEALLQSHLSNSK